MEQGIIAVSAFRDVDGCAQPFNIRTSGAAYSELNAEFILTAECASMLNVTLDVPIAVLQQPRANVTIIKIEPGGRLRTADIIAPAWFSGELAHLVGVNGSRRGNACDDKKCCA